MPSQRKRNHVLSEAWPGRQSPYTDLLSPGVKYYQHRTFLSQPSLFPRVKPITSYRSYSPKKSGFLLPIANYEFYLLEPGLASTATKMVKPKATRWAAAPEAVRRAR